MKSTNSIIKILNDLLKINRDRVAGYKKASHDTVDPGLKALFGNMADQSLKNITDITKEIVNHNGKTESIKTTNSEKLNEAWANFKIKFLNNSIRSVLTSCESREAEAIHVYQKVKINTYSVQLTDLIAKQELSLKSSLEVIKVYRQAYTKVNELYS